MVLRYVVEYKVSQKMFWEVSEEYHGVPWVSTYFGVFSGGFERFRISVDFSWTTVWLLKGFRDIRHKLYC